jgi:hypothetical protein
MAVQERSGNDYRLVLDEPVQAGANLSHRAIGKIGQRSGWRMRSRVEGEQIERGAGVSGVLYDEILESAGPPGGRYGARIGPPPMALELANDLAPRKLLSAVAAPVLSFILNPGALSGAHQIAGAGADQEMGHRPGRPMQTDQRCAFGVGGRVGIEPSAKHRPNFTQSQRAGDSEEIAHSW